MNNYWLTSLISDVSKLLEKLINERLYALLEENNSFYPYQFGFRPNHSTNSALIEITEQIRKACDKDLFSCGVYFHLKNVLDTGNQNILLTKLEYYGIKGNASYWLCSLLIDRKQYTNVTGKDLNFQEISHGVPQGSVLGPLLFMIFIIDLNLSVHQVKYIILQMIPTYY